MAGSSSISITGKLCRDLFTDVCKAWRVKPSSASADRSIESIDITVQQKKFVLWAKNICAFQDGNLPSSLESRIAKDPTMQRNILRILGYLRETLESFKSILLGEISNESWQEQGENKSDIQELYLSIRDQINNLFRLSIAIRKAPETDEYSKAALKYPQFDSSGDRTHVRAKYPHATAEPWLLERLGLAITRRRQFIMYRKHRQERLEEVHNTFKRDIDGKTIWSGTKASTYKPTIDHDHDITHSIAKEFTSEHPIPRPRTEYADSSIGKDGSTDKLRTPWLPLDESGYRIQYGDHFICPYCQRPQVMLDKAEWKKHVFSDLRPYVCTYEDCDLEMFSSQHDWFGHEVRCHRKLWFCKICKDNTLFSRPTLDAHLEAIHPHTFKDGVQNVQIETWRETRINATECPLCKDYATKLQLANQSQKCDVLLKQFQAHLGGHFEQLALAALPTELEDDLPGDVESSDAEELEMQIVDKDSLPLPAPVHTPSMLLYDWDDHKEEITSFYEEGLSVPVIHKRIRSSIPLIHKRLRSDMFQISEVTLYNKLNDWNLPTDPAARRQRTAQMREAREMQERQQLPGAEKVSDVANLVAIQQSQEE